MKIDSLKINHFGKLEEKDMTFGPQINVIYGENESGKSTLLKFMIGMFYGVSKNKNGKQISDLEKYTPWKEGEFSGKIQYHLENGKQYEVFRDFKKKNPTIYDENQVEVSKEFSIDKTKGSLFFSQQTGMDETLFCSTIVSQQAEVKLEEKEKQSMIQKVANLIGTGRDDTSFDKVISKLNKRQLEEIGTEKSQGRPINITKRKIEELEAKVQEIEHYHATQQEMQERKEDLSSDVQEKETKISALKEIKRMQEEQAIEDEKRKIKEEDVTEYKEKIKQMEERKQDLLQQDSKIEKQSYLVSVVGIIAVVLFSILAGILKNLVIGIIAALGFIFTIGSYILVKQKNKKKGSQEKEKKEKDLKVLEEQINMIQDNIEEKEKAMKELTSQIERKQEEEQSRIKNKYTNKLTNIEELLSKENIGYELEYLQNYVNGKRLELQSMELEEKTLLSGLEKLASMEEELEEEKERYQYFEEYTECIKLAKQTIEEAYICMKQEVTPKFTQNLSRYMEAISEGKYHHVILNNQNEIMVEMDNGSYVSAENLSMGTIDQIYLSLRLAMTEEIEKETMPIFLDETFAYFDEKRLGQVLEFLNNALKDRQIFIFTCTKREQQILDEKQYKYHKIEL